MVSYECSMLVGVRSESDEGQDPNPTSPVQDVSRLTKPFSDIAFPPSNDYISIYSILKNH